MTSDSASKPPLPNLSTIDRYISPRYQESTQRRGSHILLGIELKPIIAYRRRAIYRT